MTQQEFYQRLLIKAIERSNHADWAISEAERYFFAALKSYREMFNHDMPLDK